MSPTRTARAVVLTGGRSRRFGGIHKPGVPVDGVPVLARLHAVLAEVPVDGIWIVGPLDGLPEPHHGSVRQVQERPRFAGPLAGIAAAVADMPLDADAVVLLLAGDVPFADPHDLTRLILTSAQTGRAAAGTDNDGRVQHLCAAWPDALLRARLADIGDPTDTAVKRLWEGVDPVRVELSPGSVEDFDTPEDYRRITGSSAPTGQSPQSPS